MRKISFWYSGYPRTWASDMGLKRHGRCPRDEHGASSRMRSKDSWPKISSPGCGVNETPSAEPVLEELVPAVEALQQALGVPERILKLHFVEFEDCSHSHLAERQLLFPGR